MLTTSHFSTSLSNLVTQPKQKLFLLAVSGGIDSMVLLDLCYRLQLHFEVAHINYHLRNEDSNQDEQLVKQWCLRNNIEFHCYDVSEKDQRPENSIENWAREIRYRFFKEILIKRKLEYLMTGHHLNDQLETFIINLSKAAGLKGLKAIPEKSDWLLRPLLNFSREDIVAYATHHQVSFREDYTNFESVYLRNKIRNEVTPILSELNSNFLNNFNTSIGIIKESKAFIDQQIEGILKEITVKNSSFLVLNQTKAAQQSDFVCYEIFSRFGMNSVKEIRKILSAEKNKKFSTSTHQFSIGRDEILIQNKHLIERSEVIFVLESFSRSDGNTDILLPEGFVKINWNFDAEKIQLPLRLRKARKGDVFQPKGMIGRKKVSKFIRDEKISITDLANIWVIEDDDERIIGVYPLRQSHTFCASKDSKNKVIFV